jgi:hypothetical protein
MGELFHETCLELTNFATHRSMHAAAQAIAGMSHSSVTPPKAATELIKHSAMAITMALPIKFLIRGLLS